MKPFFLFFVLSALTSNLPAQPTSIDRFIRMYAKEHNFNGTIIIDTDHKIAYHKSFGFSNFQHNVLNSNETRYKIASITKLFTSVLILRLFEEGKIDLDAT